MLRVLVTGSRTWTDAEFIRRVFARYHVAHPRDRIVLVSGTAKGADKMAEEAAGDLGWIIERHPADWKHHDEHCPAWHTGMDVCKRAGHRRNEQMVMSGVDICLAFIENDSVGATSCANFATTQGVKVVRFKR